MSSRGLCERAEVLLERVRRWAAVVATTRGATVVLWLLVATQTIYGEALADAESGFRTAVSVTLWSLWAVGLVVLVLPGAIALTLGRIVVSGNVATSVWALIVIDDRSLTDHGTTMGITLAAAVAVLLPTFGDATVDASSYGDERRFLLRPPGAVVLFVLVPTWVVAVAGSIAGPLLLADQRWMIGAISTALGLPAALWALRSLHGLARRWVVFVPAGLVVHDHMSLAQPVLFAKSEISALGPASATTSATDLTAGSLGLALELQLANLSNMAIVVGRGRSEEKGVVALLVSPSRPASVLAVASERGIKIG